MKNREFSPEKKDRKKKIRSVVEFIILIIIVVIIIAAFISDGTYKPYGESNLSDNLDSGFIAVSYFGVDRNGSETLISTESLEEHLKALYDNGYLTVSQDDILKYYNEGKRLPEKSLLLSFEDGRRDSAIFAQKIMEEFNFKATMFTYAQQLVGDDPKFLKGKDLLELVDGTYWELGSNGYRLEYINVFDKSRRFLGRLTSLEFAKVRDEIRRDYNHYLMDYIRDEDGIPLESYNKMSERINHDYNEVERIYLNEIGYIPNIYALMHSNTGGFGTNEVVSMINGDRIKELFLMNFNREGTALNTFDDSVYNLTRIQPQAYWSTNHLLMRINEGVSGDMKFVCGNEEKHQEFEEVKGKAEIKDEKVILTSEPEDTGLLKLKEKTNSTDVEVSVVLKGNIIGSQAIYLMSDETRENSICLKIMNNILTLSQFEDGNENVLYTKNMDNIMDVIPRDEIDIKEQQDIPLTINIDSYGVDIVINEKVICSDIEIGETQFGNVFLESAWGGHGYSQRNISDSVYDGVFDKLIIKSNEDDVYIGEYRGFDAFIYKVKTIFKEVQNWFIDNL